MLDFWELLGRVATDGDFRDNMLKSNNGKPDQDQSCDCRVIFGANDYNGLRKVVTDTHPEIPVSLIALGEWMLIKTLSPLTNVLGDVAAAIKNAIGVPASKDRQFYQVLGLSMIDESFAGLFNGTNYGFTLSGTDRTTIQTLNKDAAFKAKRKVFHQLFWGTDCKAWMLPSTDINATAHAHPLDPDEETLFRALPHSSGRA